VICVAPTSAAMCGGAEIAVQRDVSTPVFDFAMNASRTDCISVNFTLYPRAAVRSLLSPVMRCRRRATAGRRNRLVKATLAPERPRLLVIGGGFAGLGLIRDLADSFEITVVEPKDYFEFTPGILRGLCDGNHLKTIQVPLSDALQGLGVRHVRGRVTQLQARCALLENADVDQVQFDYCVITAGTACRKGCLWKSTGRPGEENHASLKSRCSELARLREELRQASENKKPAVVVGGGLGGVELAAELRHYFPDLRVVLRARGGVLPGLQGRGQRYAAQWLKTNGVEVTGESPEEADGVVLDCTGVQVECQFAKGLECLDESGQVRVDKTMQVLTPCPEAFGRIFAAGDCVSVQGMPSYGKDAYPAEAMAEIVATNLENVLAANGGDCLLRELGGLNQFLVCSLGPHDAVFCANGIMVMSGWPAAKVKEVIEVTKMQQVRGHVMGSTMWALVPHF